MSTYVVVGAGATGRAVTEILVGQGHQVSVVSRSGAANLPEGATSVRGDASDAAFLTRVCQSVDALFNCANPPYHQWLSEWPPVANAMREAAANSGATLAILSNLYAYGAPTSPMRPSDPLVSTLPKAQVRAKMWTDALEWHEAGRLRAVEVRASDFIGKGSQSFFERALVQMRKGKTVTSISPLDIIHSWSFVPDVARTLVTVAQNPEAAGRPWHAVTNEPKTIRTVLEDLAEVRAMPAPKVRVLAPWVLQSLGLVSPLLRELPKVAYQFAAPFIIDDSETRAILGLTPTAWSDIVQSCW